MQTTAETEVHFAGNFYGSSADFYGGETIKLNLKDVVLDNPITGLAVQGVCTVTPDDGSTPYNTGLWSPVSSYTNKGFTLFPITAYKGKATYKYQGSYVALGVANT